MKNGVIEVLGIELYNVDIVLWIIGLIVIAMLLSKTKWINKILDLFVD